MLPIRLYGVHLTQCSCVDAFVVDLVIHGCSFYGSTTFGMSTRRLPVILFVSSAHYILLFVARYVHGGRGGKLFNCAQWRVNILTLSSSFAYHPPPAASIGYPPTSPLALMLRVVLLTVFVMTLAIFIHVS